MTEIPTTIRADAGLDDEQREAARWFESLRDRLCRTFEAIEDELADGPNRDRPPGRFERTAWQRAEADAEGDPGGGVMSILRGRVFEKVGVNVSTVHGRLSPEFAANIPGAGEDRRFFATGISVVAHNWSPLVPPAHFNTRFLATSKRWFGGGADLNPIYPDAADTVRFHQALKAACDRHDPAYHPRFKAWCDEYFWNKHRGEPRGVGGIFFDYLDSGNRIDDFAFVRDVGQAFLEVFSALVRQHMNRLWTDEQRRHQLVRRGRYAEFNLLYDRGTLFGLKTGGNVEAILMSLPPLAAWP